MVASQETCDAIWMRKMLMGLFSKDIDLIVIYCDNQSCIKLYENPIFHDRSKHIDIRHHHLWDCVQRRIMMLLYIPTEEQDADKLKKALSRGKLEFHKCKIRVVQNPFLYKRECQKIQQERLDLTCAIVKLSNSIFHISGMTWIVVSQSGMALSTSQFSKFNFVGQKQSCA